MGWEEMEGEHLQQRTAYTAYEKGELFSATPNHRHLSGQQAQALQDRGEEKALPHEVKIWLGRPAAHPEIGSHHIYTVLMREGGKIYCALRLDKGNFSWGSDCCTGKTKMVDGVYNASND